MLGTVTKNSKKGEHVSYTLEQFGTKIYELRCERGLTQADVAEAIGITRNTLSMYETKERTPNIDIAVQLANYFDVSLDYLFGQGFRKQQRNYYSIFEFFSEKSVGLLEDSHVAWFADEILSHPDIEKVISLIYSTHYKPLINSYETNYISRLIADLLYHIIVGINKDAYKLRQMPEEDRSELYDAVNSCLEALKMKDSALLTDYDEFVDCEDTIESELKRIRSLLDSSSQL